MAQSAEWDVRKEAIYAVANIFTGGTDTQVQTFVECDGIDAICSVLDMEDSKIVMVALEALEKILEVGERHGRAYPHCVDEVDGIDKLEALQEHANDEIYNKVVTIVEKYFGMDDVEDVEDENLAPATDGDTFAFGIPSKQLFADQTPEKSDASNAAPLQQFNFSNDFGGFHPGM